MTVALLAAVESLLSAVVADGMSGDKHNSNVELMAQGVANLVSPMVGGIPVTGAIARTATNIRSGAKTPVAGIIHALTLLGVLLVAAPLAKFIPLATLAAVLFVVAYNMGEWRQVGAILRLNRAVRMVWAATFLLTVVADLTIAVEVGMTLAALLYIYRVTQTTTVAQVTPEYIAEGRPHMLQDKDIPEYVTILRIHGPFPVRDHRETGRGYGGPERLREGRDSAGAQHDGDRCDGPARAGKAGGAGSQDGARRAGVRRAAAAAKYADARRFRAAYRDGEHSAAHPGGAGAGAADLRGDDRSDRRIRTRRRAWR